MAVEPAVLESTQLMLAHGLDLYYSRLTPSKCVGVVCWGELGRLTGKQGCSDSLVHGTPGELGCRDVCGLGLFWPAAVWPVL